MAPSPQRVVITGSVQTVSAAGYGLYVIPERREDTGAPSLFPPEYRLDRRDSRTHPLADGRARYHPEGFRTLELLGGRPGDVLTVVTLETLEDALGGGLSGREEWAPLTLLRKEGAAGNPWPTEGWAYGDRYLCNHLGLMQAAAPAPVDVRRYGTVGVTLTANLYRAPGFPSPETMTHAVLLEVLSGPDAGAAVVYAANRTLLHGESCTLIMGKGLPDVGEAFLERMAWRTPWVRVKSSAAGDISEVRSTLELWGVP